MMTLLPIPSSVVCRLAFAAIVWVIAIASGGDNRVAASGRLQKRNSLESLPEEFMNVTQTIRYHGYPVEEHSVVTADGYILGVQRIPRGRSGAKPNGHVVFLQHGLLASSSCYVDNLPNQSLGYILADIGYDVWLGNSRGNTYSRRHVEYTVDDDAFWQFSFDEMAKYDLPASIDYALNVTKQKDLFYVGHSQGTTIAFAELSRNTELAKKIKVMFGLAPVAVIKDIRGAIRLLSYFGSGIKFTLKLFGVREFLPSHWYIKLLDRAFCWSYVGEATCSNLLFLVSGFDQTNLNKTRIPIYVSHNPAGTSVQNMIHWMQLCRTTEFRMYNYGEGGNIEHYKQITPPSYQLENITTPIALFSGGNDWLADPRDVSRLKQRLNSVIYTRHIKSWNHFDFIWGIDAAKLAYADIIRIMEKHA